MEQNFTFDSPSTDDGWMVSRLIHDCPPLDENSVYCNLLQCHHFSATSVAVKLDDELVGFISGYLIPGRPDTLFIWQVAVSEKARGHGIAARMVRHILARKCCQDVRHIETTITKSNTASWALFRRVAEYYSAPLVDEPLFERDRHFSGQHDTEYLLNIGPLQRSSE